MTDPRAALADCDCIVPHEEQVKHLAERGVLLVPDAVKRLVALWREQGYDVDPMKWTAVQAEHAATLLRCAQMLEDVLDGKPHALAALSGEADQDWTWGADKQGVEA